MSTIMYDEYRHILASAVHTGVAGPGWSYRCDLCNGCEVAAAWEGKPLGATVGLCIASTCYARRPDLLF